MTKNAARIIIIFVDGNLFHDHVFILLINL
jgi:hypothetical protein